MSAIQPSDLLVRVGGKSLLRYGTLTRRVAPIARGGEQLQETFTRSTVGAFRDKTGVGRLAGVNKPRVQWYDLDGDGIYETPTLFSEGARTQLVTDPENFGAWTLGGTVARTAGQADPFGGTAAYLIDSNTPAATDAIFETVAFTGDGTKCIAGFVRAGTAAQSVFTVHDLTAGVHRHQVLITWTAGVPVLSDITGAGDRFAVAPWGSGWYAIALGANSVVAANTNRFIFYPDWTGAGGTTFFFGANAWNAVFPSNYQGPHGGASPSGADSLTLPIPFGVQDLTVYASLARPVHADAGGTLGVNPGIFDIGAAGTKHAWAFFDTTTRKITAAVESGGSVQADAALPAGASFNFIAQFNIPSATLGPRVASDIGSGLSAFSGRAPTVLTSWQNQTINVGWIATGASPLFGGLIDLFVVPGLHTLAECQAVP
jgi:hypothetical protein